MRRRKEGELESGFFSFEPGEAEGEEEEGLAGVRGDPGAGAGAGAGAGGEDAPLGMLRSSRDCPSRRKG